LAYSKENLTTDFMRIALTHREEITKLLEQHDKNVRTLYVEMEVVAKPFVPAVPETEALEDEGEEDNEVAEPSIWNVLNED
jgi:predicted HD phosphohydrolase